jgi:hypothetical protein
VDGTPWRSLGSLIERVRTGSVLAPLLALTLVVGAAALGVTFSSRESLTYALWGLFAICVVATLIAYVVWAIRDPDRLQTEDYRLARHRLEILGDERDPNAPKLLEAAPTANTHLETAS